MSVLRQIAKSFLKAEDGPTSVEYAVLLALIVTALFVTLATIGENVNGLYQAIASVAANAGN